MVSDPTCSHASGITHGRQPFIEKTPKLIKQDLMCFSNASIFINNKGHKRSFPKGTYSEACNFSILVHNRCSGVARVMKLRGTEPDPKARGS